MAVDWVEVAIEAPVFLVFLAITAYLAYAGRRHGLPGRKGWTPILLGLFVLTLYTAYDLADEFPATSLEPMVGPVNVADVLQDALLPSLGLGLLAFGLLAFLELPARLSSREQELEELSGNLEDKVHLATEHLEEANEELAASEERFRLIAKATHDTVWDWDVTTGHIWWGEGMSTWFGWDPEELEPTLEAWADLVHPEDRGRVEASLQEALEAGEEHWQDRYRFQRKDGTYAEVLDHGFISTDEDGQPVRAVGSMIDITEQHAREQELAEAQRRFQTLVDAIDEAYWIVDASALVTTYMSPGFDRVFGLAVEDVPEPEAWSELIHPEDREEVHARMGVVFEQHEEDELQYRIVRPDGEVRWVETILRLVHNEDGEVDQVAGVTRDITDHVQAHQAREAAVLHQAEVERLQEVDAFKARFLNTAAHELATPLTPVRFQLSSLTSGMYGDLSEEQEEALAMIDRNFQRLSRLVSDLLDSTRLETGHLNLQREELDVSSLVEQVRKDLAAQAEAQEIELACELEDGCQAMADPERVAQVLINLLDNAIKFTPAGGTVTLRTRQQEEFVEILVEDTGIGLDEDQIDRLFEPFDQVHEEQGVGSGTGLGLYICKGIVEQLDGEITVESDGPGQGCTVRVTLPAA